jgi:hypothetical protein
MLRDGDRNDLRDSVHIRVGQGDAGVTR